MLTVAAVLFSSPDAHAGQWIIKYGTPPGKFSGTTTYAIEKPDYTYEHRTKNWEFHMYYDGVTPHYDLAGDTSSYSDLPSNTATAINQGDVQAYALWQPSDSNSGDPRGGVSSDPSALDTPPGQFYIYEYAQVSGSGGGGGSYRDPGTVPMPTFSLSNPLGGVQVNDPSGHQASVTSGKWSRIDNSDHKNIVILPLRHLNATTTITASIQYGQPVNCDASVYYSVAVYLNPFITADPIDASYHKGPNGTKVENFRDDDGSMTADSVVDIDNLALFPWQNPQYVLIGKAFYKLNYSFLGDWWGLAGLPLTWNLSGDCSPYGAVSVDGLNSHSDEIRLWLRVPGKPSDPALQKQSVLKAKVPENGANNPEIEAKYTVNWHLPYENWKKDRTVGETYYTPELTVVDPPTSFMGGGSRCKWKYDDPMSAAYKTAGQYTLTALGSLPIVFSGMFTVLGLDIDLTVHEGEQTANFDTLWTYDDDFTGSEWHSTFYPPKSENLPMNTYRMTPELRIGYTIYQMKADAYNEHGYTGEYNPLIAKDNGSVQFVGRFYSERRRESGGGGGGK